MSSLLNMKKAKEIVSFKTGKLDSNAAEDAGIYPFFTCSQETFKINKYAYDTECVLLAGNNAAGVFPLKYYNGKFNAYQRTYIIETLNKDIFNIRYFYYYLRPLLTSFQQQATGATTKFLTIKILYNLDVWAPPIQTQKKIAAILSAYDDLIENNKRRIALLEKMAEEIYKEWFVRFRFPGWKEAEFEKGIPKGWEVIAVKTICDEIRKGIKKTNLKDNMKYLGLEHLPRKSIAIKTYNTAKSINSDKLLFQERDILFGKIRPYLHKIALAHFSGVCSTDTIVIRSKEQKHEAFLLLTVFSETFVDLATVSSKGTKMPRADWDFLKELEIIIPNDFLLNEFQAKFDDFFNQIKILILANENLVKTRNMLLPRLISGKLDVEELDVKFPDTMNKKETSKVSE